MKNIAACFILIFSYVLSISANDFTVGLSIGGSCGYSNVQKINLESQLQINVKWKRINIDAAVGVNYHPYTISYAERKDLKVNKFGLMEEITIFPFQKYLFTGLRFEVTYNWLSKNAIHTLDKHSLYAPNFYVGLGFYGITGIDLPISSSISFKIYSIYGLHT